MARILGVGIATLDIINTVEAFPEEDDEVRALSQAITRGGNATNTLVVLSQLGHQVTWAGTLADDENSRYIRDDLARYTVDTGPVNVIPRGHAPTSYVTLNRQNGSRTIVHYRDLEEYSFESFSKIDLAPFDWLHFEGRNIEQTRQMLEHARRIAPNIPLSVEIEKPRDNIRSLCSLADLLLYSRSYVQGETGQGKATHSTGSPGNPVDFLNRMARQTPTADHVCTWGRDGAYGTDRSGSTFHVPAVIPPRVIDTLGAGDTFMAGLIHGRLRGLGLNQSVTMACKLAGQKCGQSGFDGLAL
ncbi:PfkB family carbohydrate kinase [Kaarinaea lacus]